MSIMTATWYTRLPPSAYRVGISRGVPQNYRRQYALLHQLFPGDGFHKLPVAEYVPLYNAILRKLHPVDVYNALMSISDTPVLVCFENPQKIQTAICFCHRHLIAQWLEDGLGCDSIDEVDHPQLDRFAHMRANGMTPPSYVPLPITGAG